MIEMAATAPSPTLPAMTPVMGELIDDMQTPVPTENSKSLKACVQSALTHYYSAMENQTPKNVYALVIAQVEPPLIKSTLLYTRGNQSKAAILLGISRGGLRMKCQQYKIDLSEWNDYRFQQRCDTTTGKN